MNQLTGGSNSMRSIYVPVRIAAAIARQQLVAAAAKQWNVAPDSLKTANGMVTHSSGLSAGYGSLATAAAAAVTRAVAAPTLKSEADFTIRARRRTGSTRCDIVTGRKQFAMDLTCRTRCPPWSPAADDQRHRQAVHNLATVMAMPGVTDVAVIATGVAVRARPSASASTRYGRCRSVGVPGTEDRASDATVLEELKAAELPLLVPP